MLVVDYREESHHFVVLGIGVLGSSVHVLYLPRFFLGPWSAKIIEVAREDGQARWLAWALISKKPPIGVNF